MQSALTILVVEDHEPSRYAVCKVLEAAGHRVISAADHNRALATLEERETVHLLVTDIVMPGHVHGFALARMATLRRPDIRVLYTTGYGEELPGSEIRAALGPILPKPFEADVLLRAVERAVGGERGLLPGYFNRDHQPRDAAA